MMSSVCVMCMPCDHHVMFVMQEKVGTLFALFDSEHKESIGIM